jgi:hypothetical protein
MSEEVDDEAEHEASGARGESRDWPFGSPASCASDRMPTKANNGGTPHNRPRSGCGAFSAATVRPSRWRSDWRIVPRKATTLAVVGLVLGSGIESAAARRHIGSELEGPRRVPSRDGCQCGLTTPHELRSGARSASLAGLEGLSQVQANRWPRPVSFMR